ncbi:MAG: hypothetical protein RQ754_02865 [Desulfuromonadales bacterium]|nr:hypothetical protein [Desulfuromonadales bacterium]
MSIDPSAVVVGGIMAASNIGGVWALIKVYMRRVDDTNKITTEHSILLARTAENQMATAETLTRLNQDVRELFQGKNRHSENLTEINTLHETKGCKTLYQGDRR